MRIDIVSWATGAAVVLGSLIATTALGADWSHDFEDDTTGGLSLDPNAVFEVSDGFLWVTGNPDFGTVWAANLHDTFTDVVVSSVIVNPGGNGYSGISARHTDPAYSYWAGLNFRQGEFEIAKAIAGEDRFTLGVDHLPSHLTPRTGAVFLELEVVDEADGAPRITARLFDEPDGEELLMLTAVDHDLGDHPAHESGFSLFWTYPWGYPLNTGVGSLSSLGYETPPDDLFVPGNLMPGDANRDLVFDQLDLVQVMQAAKYLTGEAATWGEGDWDGAPGGSPGSPPTGNGLFDQEDIVLALRNAHYLTGPYTASTQSGHAPAAVPEPGGIALLLFGCLPALLGVHRFRRRRPVRGTR